MAVPQEPGFMVVVVVMHLEPARPWGGGGVLAPSPPCCFGPQPTIPHVHGSHHPLCALLPSSDLVPLTVDSTVNCPGQGVLRSCLGGMLEGLLLQRTPSHPSSKCKSCGGWAPGGGGGLDARGTDLLEGAARVERVLPLARAREAGRCCRPVAEWRPGVHPLPAARWAGTAPEWSATWHCPAGGLRSV